MDCQTVAIDRIQQLSTDRLEALAEALLDFTRLNDLGDWLEDDRPPSSKWFQSKYSPPSHDPLS